MTPFEQAKFLNAAIKNLNSLRESADCEFRNPSKIEAMSDMLARLVKNGKAGHAHPLSDKQIALIEDVIEDETKFLNGMIAANAAAAAYEANKQAAAAAESEGMVEDRVEDRIVDNVSATIEEAIIRAEARTGGKVIRQHSFSDGSYVLIVERRYEDMQTDMQTDMPGDGVDWDAIEALD